MTSSQKPNRHMEPEHRVLALRSSATLFSFDLPSRDLGSPHLDRIVPQERPRVKQENSGKLVDPYLT